MDKPTATRIPIQQPRHVDPSPTGAPFEPRPLPKATLPKLTSPLDGSRLTADGSLIQFQEWIPGGEGGKLGYWTPWRPLSTHDVRFRKVAIPAPRRAPYKPGT